MQSRFPNETWENGLTAEIYTVLQGFDYLFEDFQPWLARQVEASVHGHLFAPERVQFAGREKTFRGGLSDSAQLRDYNPYAFLKNLIWNTRGQHQCFALSPFDHMEDVHWEIVKDPNARISIVSGAWLIKHFQMNQNFTDIRKDAAIRQKLERDHLTALKSPHVKAKYRTWTLAEFLENPVENLRLILDDFEPGLGQGLTEAPKMVDLTGFGTFVRTLKNQGMHPYLLGEFDEGRQAHNPQISKRKPYLVR